MQDKQSFLFVLVSLSYFPSCDTKKKKNPIYISIKLIVEEMS